MPFETRIVPMPRWSTPVGCTKLILSLIVLAFIAACTAIWGSYPAFELTLFTASFSLVTFGYYLTALSFEPALYNKWVVLTLEALLTVFWFISLVLLAGWTGASGGGSWSYYNLNTYPGLYATTGYLSKRDWASTNPMGGIWEPSRLYNRQGLQAPRTRVRVHGMDAHYTAQILAGISAGLAGLIFILYAVTLATFSMNLHRNILNTSDPQTSITSPADQEAQTHNLPQSSATRGSIETNATSTPATSERLYGDVLPTNSESKCLEQQYYLSPEEATEAGIDPPTPITKARDAERVLESDREQTSMGVVRGEKGKRKDVLRDDGKIEREV